MSSTIFRVGRKQWRLWRSPAPSSASEECAQNPNPSRWTGNRGGRNKRAGFCGHQAAIIAVSTGTNERRKRGNVAGQGSRARQRARAGPGRRRKRSCKIRCLSAPATGQGGSATSVVAVAHPASAAGAIASHPNAETPTVLPQPAGFGGSAFGKRGIRPLATFQPVGSSLSSAAKAGIGRCLPGAPSDATAPGPSRA